MNWNQLISAKRFGMEEFHEERQENRSEFQRDYDRLISPRLSADYRIRRRYFLCRAASLYTTGSRIASKSPASAVPWATMLPKLSCNANRNFRNLSCRRLVLSYPPLAWRMTWETLLSVIPANGPYPPSSPRGKVCA